MSPELEVPAIEGVGGKSDNALLTVAIIAVVVAAIGFFMTYSSVFALEKILLAPDTDVGDVDVIISDNIDIEVDASTASIDWGSGTVTTGQTAVLSTVGAGTLTDFTGGSLQSQGFIVRNIGNVDVHVDAESSNDVDGFLGDGTPGSALSSIYQLRATETEVGACVDTVGGGTVWETNFDADIDGSGDGTRICQQLSFDDSGVGTTPDEIVVDVIVNIDSAVPPTTASSTITFTGEDYTV